MAFPGAINVARYFAFQSRRQPTPPPPVASLRLSAVRQRRSSHGALPSESSLATLNPNKLQEQTSVTQHSGDWQEPDVTTAAPHVRRDRRAGFVWLSIASLIACLATGCVAAPLTSTNATGIRNVLELVPGIPVGYLTDDIRPDSLKLVPPPPAPGSAAMALDEELRVNAVAMRGSPRWRLAKLDADLNPRHVREAHVLSAFECALGTGTSRQQTPRLYQMMQRVMVDSSYSTVAAKKKYQRARPFVAHNDAMCTPAEDGELRTNGSYPSGHGAIGWASALVLAQLAPGRADRLIARGRSFGESRLICNVHWMSDVVSGRVMGAATVARLQSVPEFAEDMVISREEIARSRSAGSSPARDCSAEAEVLSETLKDAL